MEDRPGARLKRAIHIARAHTDFDSDMQLSIAAGVHYDTLMNWYASRTTPRPHELRKVAKTLGVQYADLWSAYEGVPVEPPSLAQAIGDLIPRLDRLIRALERDSDADHDHEDDRKGRDPGTDLGHPDRDRSRPYLRNSPADRDPVLTGMVGVREAP